MKEELNLMIEMLSDTIGTRAVDALGFLLAFALTALMDSMFRERLPRIYQIVQEIMTMAARSLSTASCPRARPVVPASSLCSASRW